MQLCGTTHVGVLTLSILGTILAGWIAATQPLPARKRVAHAMAFILVANTAVVLWNAHRNGWLTLQVALPMHLCDWTTAIVVVALISGSKLLCELAWFWGLAGTAQGIFTPDLASDFPSLESFTFFVSHCFIVFGGVFAPIHWRHDLSFRSVRNAFLALQAYALAAMAANLATGANYGYLMGKPSRPSLLDFLGPWPWYVLAIEAVSLLSFILLLGVWRGAAGPALNSLRQAASSADP